MQEYQFIDSHLGAVLNGHFPKILCKREANRIGNPSENCSHGINIWPVMTCAFFEL